MQQTRKHSAIETFSNVLIGYFVALASQLAIFPLFGIHVHFRDNILIGLYFTVISIIRSYCLRRWFTRRIVTLQRESDELEYLKWCTATKQYVMPTAAKRHCERGYK